ncbi:NAD(P)/FAD-dependent oxidoreductase [Nonomuraea terrae]|uniref:NAD(P)/FAD-dependent oxidoreductase n=1 Tax=Nonomuraea terrae TaxID=2530383 RepID=UPI001CB6C568|nr:FAD-dependent oxidoreductase [Nonomuraea terrae]
MLLDLAPKVLPELDPRLSRSADRVLRSRGVEVLTGTSVREATTDGVWLTTGEFVPTRTLAWCVGVRPDPLVNASGFATQRGRLVVDTTLAVQGHSHVFACGDAAAVPDVTRPGEVTAMTAQHASRQGTLAGRNVAASLGHGRVREYKHHDLGFVVDLGGSQAAANPFHIPMSGWLAKIVTRGYTYSRCPGTGSGPASTGCSTLCWGASPFSSDLSGRPPYPSTRQHPRERRYDAGSGQPRSPVGLDPEQVRPLLAQALHHADHIDL